jgi:hypothetical protein
MRRGKIEGASMNSKQTVSSAPGGRKAMNPMSWSSARGCNPTCVVHGSLAKPGAGRWRGFHKFISTRRFAQCCDRIAAVVHTALRGQARSLSSILLANSLFQSDHDGRMKKKQMFPPPFQTGQVWELEGSNVEIGMVGKLLVHHKHSKDKARRTPISLTSKTQLEGFLQKKKAVLAGA